mgnify:CR=1 FL=1
MTIVPYFATTASLIHGTLRTRTVQKTHSSMGDRSRRKLAHSYQSRAFIHTLMVGQRGLSGLL